MSSAKRPWGETSMGRTVNGAKSPDTLSLQAAVLLDGHKIAGRVV